MKKWIVVLMLSLACCISACSNEDTLDEITEKSNSEKNIEINDDTEEVEMEVEVKNRAMIAMALGIEENSSNISVILSCLNTVNAGQIQNAEYAVVDGDKVINVVAEDEINYRIYLSRSGNVEAIQNLDTDEWPIQSTR